MTHRRGRQSGFTLLEMLVATTLMAIAIGGALSALSTTTRNAGRLTDHDRAAMFARRKLDELLLDKKLPPLVLLEGAWDPTYTGGKQSGWRARISPFEWPPQPSAGVPILQRIEVEIWWVEPTGNRRTFQADGFRRGLLTQREIDSGALGPVQQ